MLNFLDGKKSIIGVFVVAIDLLLMQLGVYGVEVSNVILTLGGAILGLGLIGKAEKLKEALKK